MNGRVQLQASDLHFCQQLFASTSITNKISSLFGQSQTNLGWKPPTSHCSHCTWLAWLGPLARCSHALGPWLAWLGPLCQVGARRGRPFCVMV